MRERKEHVAVATRGHVAVSILDERGKIRNKVEADNYINTAPYEDLARTLQRNVWTYGMSPGIVTPTAQLRDPRAVPRVSGEILGCWTDNTAEDDTDVFAYGEVTCWAHRWSSGLVAMPKQGFVVPALCEVSEDHAKWVFEWNSPNGNGTFQSVGWRRLVWNSTTDDSQLADVALFTNRLTSEDGFSPHANSSNTFNQAYGTCSTASWYDHDTDILWQILDGASSQRRLFYASITWDAAGNYTVGAVSEDTTTMTNAGIGVSSASMHTYSFIKMPGGDFIIAASTGSNTARRPLFRRVSSSNVTEWSVTRTELGTPNSESAAFDLTTDGTYLYGVTQVVSGYVSKIWRMDPATGGGIVEIVPSGVPATIGGSSANFISGIEWDGTWLWCRNLNYIWNIDTSGVWGGVMLAVTNNAPSLTLTGPQDSRTTTHYIQNFYGNRDIDGYSPNFGNNTGGVGGSTDPFSQTPYSTIDYASMGASYGSSLFTMNNNLVAQVAAVYQDTAQAWAHAAFNAVPNFASRALLGSPVTKTSDDTMRIEYTIEFT